jgi:hypothetical protein
MRTQDRGAWRRPTGDYAKRPVMPPCRRQTAGSIDSDVPGILGACEMAGIAGLIPRAPPHPTWQVSPPSTTNSAPVT